MTKPVRPPLAPPQAPIGLFVAEAERAGISTIVEESGRDLRCGSFDSLLEGLRTGGLAAAVVAADLLSGKERRRLGELLRDGGAGVPVVLLAARDALEDVEPLLRSGRVTLAERPLHPAILTAALQAALRMRSDGAGAEADLGLRRTMEADLREIAASLEARVKERMGDLRAAHDRLLREAEEREAAQARLRESEELYRFTVELSQQLAWTANVEGTIEALSPRFGEITGIDPEVPAHQGWLAAMHPDDIAPTMAEWAFALKHGVPHRAEFRMRIADGSYHRFGARAAPRFDADGRIVRWYGFTEDIEERKQAEERLRESEELYRYTMELGQQIAWMDDVDGQALTISPQFYALTGLPESAQPREAIHPDDREAALAAWARALATGEPHLQEFRLRMKDGSYRHFRARAAARRDETGRIVRWYGMMEDIHDQKQAQRALLEAEERYRLAARATNDAIWDLDLVHDQIHWSDSAGGVFGHPAGDSTSLNWWEDHIHPDDRERVVESFRGAVSGNQLRWAGAYRFRTMNHGYAHVFDRGFIIRDESGGAVRAVGAMTDVTERRRAEAELRRMQSELIHVSRLSAMGTMASTLAHEINQPLTAVTSYLRGCRRLLESDGTPQMQPVKDALEAAEAGALRAGQIVRRLRELVSKGTVSVAAEDLPELIKDAALIGFVDEHLHGVTHQLELDPDAVQVSVDRIQIQQVLINLIRNAMQAMRDQPVRVVSIATAVLSRSMVEVRVADSGVGIAAEVREALFSPFQSTKAEGMGIGLSISRTIVEAHGGKIWAEDRDGGGTVFRFTLPRLLHPATTEGGGNEDDPAA